MRNSLWSIIAIVGAIMGFVMGYATAPMMETGMLTGKAGARGPKIEASKDLKQYYQDLFKEE